ncbi:NAD(P)/FAD-dependent oxidoreductase [Maricurvus nonylphenolicus]|uniref:flavin-containing monooxygenase n=1 Tax=Maricurvus nonylphenolicus TaxID=1008307 RepID=UPI0036F40D2B
MSKTTQHFDVLIVGAGISGIGAARHLSDQCPDKSFCVLDSLESYGGTWLTHKYPGIRSDSDMFTFGYRFKPWVDAPIATGEAILKYLGEVISEAELKDRIRYQHEVLAADWCSEKQLWTLSVNNKASGETCHFTTNFLWMCQGYYDHNKGYVPEWPGVEKFEGKLIHPQHWPEDLNYADKEVIIIGSGATTATVAPAIAGDCKHVTVLQRSPTYFFARPNDNALATQLRELDVEPDLVHDIARKQVLKEQFDFIQFCAAYPDVANQELIKGVKAQLNEGFDVGTHFTPRYNAWRQRIAAIPNGDLFKGINSGQVTMVTDEIECFTEKGITLKSGKELTADIIVSATGFNISVFGGIEFSVDNTPVDFGNTVNYRGMMFTGVPNMAWIMGYFRASWTLRVDLISDFICRMLNHMDNNNISEVSVKLPEEDLDKPLRPWGDPEVFNPSYLMRSMHLLPKRGPGEDWQLSQDYWVEREELPKVDLNNGVFDYK